jgi:hypothetical protein
MGDGLLRLSYCVLVIVTVAASMPAVAVAHPRIEEARAKFEQASFEPALALLEEAGNANDLARDDVVALLRLRALVHLALGKKEAMATDVRMLVGLEPDARFGPSVPPEIVEQAEAARREAGAPLAVVAGIRPSSSGIRIVASVDGEPASLVQRIDVYARSGDGAWRRGTTSVSVEGSQLVRYYAEAIGPGGAVLASDGTRAEPLRFGEPVDTGDAAGSPNWLAVGLGTAGAVILAGVAVSIAVVATGGEGDRTQPTAPMVVFE